MLTELKVWNFIKQRFGIPYTFFELNYDQTIWYIKNYTLPYFSRFVPYKTFRRFSPELKITNSTWKLPVDDNESVISVVKIYQPNNLVIVGYPIQPIVSGYDAVINYLYDITEAEVSAKYTKVTNLQFEFIPPNLVKIVPVQDLSNCVVELELVHKDFTTIPAQFERYFLDLAVADIKDVLADIRSKYSEITTPFGTINLNADSLKSEAEQIRSYVIERLETLPPNIELDVW